MGWSISSFEASGMAGWHVLEAAPLSAAKLHAQVWLAAACMADVKADPGLHTSEAAEMFSSAASATAVLLQYVEHDHASSTCAGMELVRAVLK